MSLLASPSSLASLRRTPFAVCASVATTVGKTVGAPLSSYRLRPRMVETLRSAWNASSS